METAARRQVAYKARIFVRRRFCAGQLEFQERRGRVNDDRDAPELRNILEHDCAGEFRITALPRAECVHLKHFGDGVRAKLCRNLQQAIF